MVEGKIRILGLEETSAVSVKNTGYFPVSVPGKTYRVPVSEIADIGVTKEYVDGAVRSEAQLRSSQDADLALAIYGINDKIPSAASSTNKLVDQVYMDNQMNQVAAKYLSRDVDGNPFASYEQFVAAQSSGSFFYAGESAIPTKNDYVLVSSDSTQGNAVTRYWYTGSSWSFQYVVNNTPFTDAEWAAIRSGVTADKITQYDGYATDKADKSYVDEMLGDVESLLAAL